ncbi:MAG: glycosyltransferase family 2 protein [Bacillota bacterium]|nr:glycosyltransferase family 2 protein [Bacillota bacterium]
MKVAAIVPAYNEEQTIGKVIYALQHTSLVDRIIVVSDGSEDRTVEAASVFDNVEIIELLENRGKGGAIKVGLDHCREEVILIIDADLIGLNIKHIESLLEPVIEGRAEMSVGIFEKGRTVTDFAQKMAPFLSGQRAIRRDLLENVSDLNLSRFGIEVALHQYAEEKQVAVEIVQLPDLSHVMKEEKLGFWKGILARVRMYWEILRYVLKIESKASKSHLPGSKKF